MDSELADKLGELARDMQGIANEMKEISGKSVSGNAKTPLVPLNRLKKNKDKNSLKPMGAKPKKKEKNPVKKKINDLIEELDSLFGSI